MSGVPCCEDIQRCIFHSDKEEKERKKKKMHMLPTSSSFRYYLDDVGRGALLLVGLAGILHISVICLMF